MAYEEIKFKKSKVVKNKPKPKSKHIKTADLGTVAQFLSDNIGNIATGVAALNLGIVAKAGHMVWKMRKRNREIMNRFKK